MTLGRVRVSSLGLSEPLYISKNIARSHVYFSVVNLHLTSQSRKNSRFIFGNRDNNSWSTDLYFSRLILRFDKGKRDHQRKIFKIPTLLVPT